MSAAAAQAAPLPERPAAAPDAATATDGVLPAKRPTGAQLYRRVMSPRENKRRMADKALLPCAAELVLRAVASLVAGGDGECFATDPELCPGGLPREVALQLGWHDAEAEIVRNIEALARARLIVLDPDQARPVVRLVLPPVVTRPAPQALDPSGRVFTNSPGGNRGDLGDAQWAQYRRVWSEGFRAQKAGDAEAVRLAWRRLDAIRPSVRQAGASQPSMLFTLPGGGGSGPAHPLETVPDMTADMTADTAHMPISVSNDLAGYGAVDLTADTDFISGHSASRAVAAAASLPDMDFKSEKGTAAAAAREPAKSISDFKSISDMAAVSDFKSKSADMKSISPAACALAAEGVAAYGLSGTDKAESPAIVQAWLDRGYGEALVHGELLRGLPEIERRRESRRAAIRSLNWFTERIAKAHAAAARDPSALGRRARASPAPDLDGPRLSNPFAEVERRMLAAQRQAERGLAERGQAERDDGTIEADGDASG